ncbi:mechanosensitive ion channel [Shewanella sp. 202IG2-18]|uniref:mechanosensitive ion channel family protein n=1 Tax=Parashewanella hymeniacidonis TaxID=2807618 RepID=UPI00195F92ED|nr:mechanosensitive ion channel domain-containing protein [Parashewanella hymeniacidonis]MBM7073154.1 mechanosensitive ion channel [Parashewanella hymeniacidonis]
MEKDFPIDIAHWLMGYGLNANIASILSATLMLFVSFIFVWFLYLIAKRVIVKFLHILIKHTKAKWDDVFVEYQVFDKLIVILPVLVLSELMPYVLSEHAVAATIAQRGLSLIVVVLVVRAIYSALDAGHAIAEVSHLTRRLPIKSFVQLVKLFLFFIGVILATAAITKESPFFFLSGLGVATGLIMLVFKDTILGFVAGIQLATNRMISVGDWIQMDKYGADGSVVEVSLTTVKVKNWDNTLTMIPAYALVSDSFKNWQGMSESGGRRIKRAVNIDIDTVHFLTGEDKIRLAKINHLKRYLPEIEQKISADNERIEDIDNIVNGRRLTNLGTFRAYLREFVTFHPKVHKGMTILVRQLAPTQTGVPIELYIFTNDTNWNHYEDIQADIFDHIFAILPQFGLKVYQAPSGNDVRQIGKL